jgi:hypothetical protein
MSNATNRKRLSKEQSTLLCTTYTRLKGKWDSILADPSIKKLGYTKEFYASHINNKKKKIKKAVSEVDKGTISM